MGSPLRNLSEDERAAVVNALYLARDKYKENAIELVKMENHQQLADQFTRQALDAEKLAELIENADELGIRPGVA